MVNSPISIPLTVSPSRNPSALVKTQAIAAAALRIEQYINSQMDQDYIREFDFAALAVEPVSYTHLTLPTICSV